MLNDVTGHFEEATLVLQRYKGLLRAVIIVGERVVDDLQAHLDRHFVGRCAVFPQQKLKSKETIEG